MQDRYAGDVGDFGMFGLLKAICRQQLRLGVNWYLCRTGAFERHRQDGRHRISDAGAICDREMAMKLREIFDAGDYPPRSVASLEKAGLLTNTVYYSAVLEAPKTPGFSRTAWHNAALAALSSCDIVLLDPDNGRKVKSVGEKSQQSVKYCFDNEISDYLSRGQSVVLYNHRSRISQADCLLAFELYFRRLGFIHTRWFDVSFHKGSVRDYFFIAQPEHQPKIEAAIDDLMHSAWSAVFTRAR